MCVPYEAHIYLRFLFVHQCGLYHRLTRSFSQVFFYYFDLLRELITGVGSPTAFARGTLILITKTLFSQQAL